MIETGDVVLHEPSGEEWLVAFVEDGRLSWLGWTEGTANVADCKLVKKGTQEYRDIWQRDMLRLPDSDIRGRWARNHVTPNVKVSG